MCYDTKILTFKATKYQPKLYIYIYIEREREREREREVQVTLSVTLRYITPLILKTKKQKKKTIDVYFNKSTNELDFNKSTKKSTNDMI